MKIFISQPMNGRNNRSIIEERQPIIEKYEKAGHEVINSVLDMGPGSAIKYLAKAIELLDDADMIFMMKGWEKSRGCRIEHDVAVFYGREVIYQND